MPTLFLKESESYTTIRIKWQLWKEKRNSHSRTERGIAKSREKMIFLHYKQMITVYDLDQS